ncbi:hypothetical protein D3C78_1738620 [compost metagenome]
MAITTSDGELEIIDATNNHLGKAVDVLAGSEFKIWTDSVSNPVDMGGVTTELSGNTDNAGSGESITITNPAFIGRFIIAIDGYLP